MHTIPSFVTAKIKTTVDINGVATPFNLALNSLQRFCRPLLFHRDHEVCELAYSGSNFLFRHRGRNFMMSTKHQLRMDGGNLEPKDLILVINEGDKRIALTPSDVTRVIVDSYLDKTTEDILLAEYRSQRGLRDLDRYFVNLDLDIVRTLTTAPQGAIALIFAIGYPARFSDMDFTYDEDGMPVTLSVVNRWAKLYLEPRESGAWDMETRIPLKVHERFPADIGDLDGFSGSPVLFIWQDHQSQTHLGFAGMITHGDGSRFQIYPAETIRRVVNDICDAAEVPACP